MARNASLTKLDVPALLKLRNSVEGALVSMRDTLSAQLASLGIGGAPKKRGRPVASRKKAHALAGRKLALKYKDPATGVTWSGRGMTPKWIAAYEADGRSRLEFATKGAAPKAKKRRVKKAARK